jgi:hypothetical protein
MKQIKMKNLFSRIKKIFTEIDAIHRQKAIEDMEWEVQELKHIFALATRGNVIGIPSAPLPITFEMLPDMHEEFAIMLSKINTAHSPLSDHFSKLDVA